MGYKAQLKNAKPPQHRSIILPLPPWSQLLLSQQSSISDINQQANQDNYAGCCTSYRGCSWLSTEPCFEPQGGLGGRREGGHLFWPWPELPPPQGRRSGLPVLHAASELPGRG